MLRTSAATVSEGMLANTADTGSLEYNTVDGTLWFVHALDRHIASTGDDDLGGELAPVVGQIVDHHLQGTRFGIGVDPADGLLRQGAEGWALTWMDARIDGVPVTPRAGKPVEVNALWVRALRVAARLQSSSAAANRLTDLADRAQASFVSRFVRPDGAGLFDVVDGPGGDDASVRPNQLLAVSLPDAPLAGGADAARAAVDVCRRSLLTPLGLRSLSPDDPAYRPYHRGNSAERDSAYHQGTVWPWLIGPYVDAARAVGVPVDGVLAGLEAHLGDWGVGSVSETADGAAPHAATGCPFQAWSVAEVPARSPQPWRRGARRRRRAAPQGRGHDGRSPARAHPRRRLRRDRSRAEAEGRRCRRGARRPARLPHLPAAPLPGRHRSARDERGRSRAPRPLPRPAERHRPPGDRLRHRPRAEAGQLRGDGAARLRLSRPGARGEGELLRDARGSRARLPDVHARRRRAPARARARALGGGRPRSLADRRRRAQRRHRRRRPDGRRERRRARRALPEQLRQGLPLDPAGEGTPDPRRGGPRAVLHVSRGSAGLRGALAEAPHRRGDDRRGRGLGRADSRDAEVGRGDPGPHARLGRRSPGEPGRRRARSRPRARPSNPGRARPDGAGPSGAVRRRRHRLDHRREGRPRAPAARLGRAPGRRACRRDHRPARQGQGGRSRSATTTRARWRRSAVAPRSCSSGAAAP